jgi:hypothetical protein
VSGALGDKQALETALQAIAKPTDPDAFVK